MREGERSSTPGALCGEELGHQGHQTKKLKYDEAEMMEKAGFAVVVEQNHLQ